MLLCILAEPGVIVAELFCQRLHDLEVAARFPNRLDSLLGVLKVEVPVGPVEIGVFGKGRSRQLSECGRPQADAGTLARQLLIGLDERFRVASGPVEVAGRPAWSQTFETREGGQRIRVKSVTLTTGPCTFDWVLVAPGDFGEAEQEFDRWWPTWVHNSQSLASRDGERAP